MSGFNIEKLAERKLAGERKITIKITPKDGGNFDMEDVRKVADDMERYTDSTNFLIRVMGPVHRHTVKKFDSELFLQEYEDYFFGKVVNPDKFNNFSFVEVTYFVPN